MKWIREYTIASIFIIACIIALLTLTGSLFIEGTSGIWYGHRPKYNSTSSLVNHLILILSESGGFQTHHLIDNIIFELLFTSFMLYIGVYLKKKIVKYLSTLGYDIKLKSLEHINMNCTLRNLLGFVQISMATLWEYLEKTVIYSGETFVIVFPSSYFIMKYVTGGEHYMNSWLADITQAFFAHFFVLVFVVVIKIVPVSYYLYKRDFISIFVRFVVYAISGLSTLLTFFKKKYSFLPFSVNTGFYMHCCIRILMMTLLYVDDIKSNIKHRRKINRFWFMILGFLCIEWIATLDLRAWGFISSNVAAFIYFWIWFAFALWKERRESHKLSQVLGVTQ